VQRESPAKPWQIVQLPEVESAFISLDPQDGAVRALVGGFDFNRNKFNHVTQAWRQPGSSFKPFIYSAALEAGLTPATVVLDAPVVYEAPDASVGIGQGKEPAVEGEEPEQEDWRPGNDTDRFYGPTRLRDALARSRNLVTIRVMRQIGVPYARDYVTRFGLPKDHIPPDLTAALGTAQNAAQIAEVIAPEGHLGLIEGAVALKAFDPGPLFAKSVGVHLELMFTRATFGTPSMIEQHRLLTEIADLVDRGTIRTTLKQIVGPIDATHLKQAHAVVESGKAIGKVVLAGWPAT